MDHHVVTLLGVAPDDFFVWLSKLKTMAEVEQQRNPYRPQSPPLQVLRVDPHHIPLPGRREGRIYQGLYIAPPGPSAPFGHPAVVFSLQPQTADRLRTVLGYLMPGFPLDSAEIVWLLEQCFPHVPRLYPLIPGQRVELDKHELPGTAEHCVEAPSVAVPMSNDPPPEPVHQRGGRLPLPSSLWLEDQMRTLKDPHEHDHLFDDWLEEYKLCVHQAPRDPRRSFQRAAEGCLRRL